MVESKRAAEREGPLAVLDMMAAAVLLTDAAGKVLWGNGASEVLLGCSRRTFVGTNFRDRLSECADWYAHLESGAVVESARVLGRLLRAHPGAQPTTCACRQHSRACPTAGPPAVRRTS